MSPGSPERSISRSAVLLMSIQTVLFSGGDGIKNTVADAWVWTSRSLCSRAI
jgi:hypothetical protein